MGEYGELQSAGSHPCHGAQTKNTTERRHHGEEAAEPWHD